MPTPRPGSGHPLSENRETAYRGAPLDEDGAAQGPPPDADERTEDGIRGDGLAEAG